MTTGFFGEVFNNISLGVPAVRLGYSNPDARRSSIVEVSPHFGSNMYKFQVGGHDLIVCDNELLKDRDWTGTFVLWPIPNRVRNKSYEFEGHVQPLENVRRKRGNESLIHGFVDDIPWQFSEPVVSENGVSFQTWIDVEKNGPIYSYFPYKSKLTLTYTLTSPGIKIEYAVENKDSKTLPFGFALHPYFATLSGRDATQIVLPADYIMEADDELLPSGRLLAMGSQGYDLRQPTAVSTLELDHVFTGLHDHTPPAILYPDQNLQLTLAASPEFTHMVLYTLESDKGFICFENQTGSTDMINLYTKAKKESDVALEKAAHLMTVPAAQSHTGFIEYRVTHTDSAKLD